MKNIAKKLPLLVLAILLLTFGLFNTIPTVSGDVSPIAASNSDIDYVATNRNGNQMDSTDIGDYLNSRYIAFSWSEIRSVNLSISESGKQSILSTQETETYNYSWKVEYFQRYFSLDFDFNNDSDPVRPPKGEVENILSGTKTSLDEIDTLTYYFDNFPDDVNAETSQEKTHKNYGIGWGIYKFTLYINSTPLNSDYFVIRPYVPKETPPVIKSEAKSSDLSIASRYNFWIDTEKSENYLYVDVFTLVWHLEGETLDGQKYVLLPEDIGEAEDVESMFTAYDRTGLTFTIDFTQKYQGKWKITCQVVDNQDKSVVKLISNTIFINSGEPFSKLALILIISSVALVVLILIVVFIIIRIKKEKVW